MNKTELVVVSLDKLLALQYLFATALTIAVALGLALFYVLRNR